MDTLTARPRAGEFPQIRRVIKRRGTGAEIAGETQIKLYDGPLSLAEMMENGEIESIGHDESSGGRKRRNGYRFKPDKYYGAAICISAVRCTGVC